MAEEIVHGFKELGIDLIKELKTQMNLSEPEVLYLLRLVTDRRLFENTLGVSPEEYYLKSEGFTSEEARFVANNPCLVGPVSECDYHKQHSRCGICCTNFNGWLFYKTSPDGKLRPNYRALVDLPKDTLYLKEPTDEQTLKAKLKDFLNEP